MIVPFPVKNMRAPPTPLLDMRGVTKAHGATAALRGLDLLVTSGQFVALVGSSGSGKTTLLKCLNRLVEPDAGDICFEGRDVRSFQPHELRRRIGYVFQGVGLFPHMTVAENIAIGLRLSGVDAAERRERVADLLRLDHLPQGYASRLPDALSGGQAQRVGVARALAAKPSLMLMDEPFGALDALGRETLARRYRELHDTLGLTTIMVTHDMTEALLNADRIVALDHGRIRADASPAELMAMPRRGFVGRLIDAPRRQAARLARLERGA
jgi:osmoprotectant transport system ATP-binding protein